MSNTQTTGNLNEIFNSIRRSKSNPKKSWNTYSSSSDESEKDLNSLKEELQAYWKRMNKRAPFAASYSN